MRALFTYFLVGLLLACPVLCRATDDGCCADHEVQTFERPTSTALRPLPTTRRPAFAAGRSKRPITAIHGSRCREAFHRQPARSFPTAFWPHHSSPTLRHRPWRNTARGSRLARLPACPRPPPALPLLIFRSQVSPAEHPGPCLHGRARAPAPRTTLDGEDPTMPAASRRRSAHRHPFTGEQIMKRLALGSIAILGILAIAGAAIAALRPDLVPAGPISDPLQARGCRTLLRRAWRPGEVLHALSSRAEGKAPPLPGARQHPRRHLHGSATRKLRRNTTSRCARRATDCRSTSASSAATVPPPRRTA